MGFSDSDDLKTCKSIKLSISKNATAGWASFTKKKIIMAYVTTKIEITTFTEGKGFRSNLISEPAINGCHVERIILYRAIHFSCIENESNKNFNSGF